MSRRAAFSGVVIAARYPSAARPKRRASPSGGTPGSRLAVAAMANPPAPYIARPAAVGDAEAMAALANASALALVGEAVATGEELRGELEAPGLPRHRRSLVVEAPDGQLAAFLLLFAGPPFAEVTAFADVEPAHRGRGLGTFLVTRAQELAAALAPDGDTVLRWDAWVGHEELFALLGRHGFAPVRHFWRMRAALDDAGPEAVWPAGIVVRTFRPGDEGRVHAALGEAFRGNWGHAEETLEHFVHERIEGAGAHFDPTLWFLALDGDELAGVAICQRHDASEPGAGYVRELACARRGVAAAWRWRSCGTPARSSAVAGSRP